MTQEQTEGQVVAPAEQPADSGKMYTNEDMKKIVEERLKNAKKEDERKQADHAKKLSELNSRIAELEGKEKDGTATTGEQLELQKGKEVAAKSEAQGIPPEAMPYIVAQEMQKQKFIEKMQDAVGKDPEFKQLATSKNASQLVNDEAMSYAEDLDNAPAVLKHLLKDKRENSLMQAKLAEANFKQSPSIMVEYMNSLSMRLEQNATKPRASGYTPDPDISDMGDSSQDFDLKKHVANYR